MLMLRLLFFIFILAISPTAIAILNMELTHGIAGAIPIAIVPFAVQDNADQVGHIITNDLRNSGRFNVYKQNALTFFPTDAKEVSQDYFRRIGTDHVVVGKVAALGSDRFQVSFQLLDILRGPADKSIILNKKYTVSGRELRGVAHHISDLIYQQLTGIPGIFSTKLAYVMIQRNENGQMRYTLEVADQDGYNPRPLLNSPEPIMSPAWAPNGKQVAYVSFEGKQASIYVQNVITGSRRLISKFPGINGAPAWSPDGQKLAIVLSKSGSPNIYIMDIRDGSLLRQLTRDFYINTEPAWAPQGQFLLFTSNRSGSPQIYQLSLRSGEVSRLTYQGDYNARGSYTRDGHHVVMIHRVSSIYRIGILDLDSGTLRVLDSTTGDSSSPSVAPNGGMVLFDTVYGGQNVLAMVSVEGNVRLRLPPRYGEAQDPAWSPFQS